MEGKRRTFFSGAAVAALIAGLAAATTPALAQQQAAAAPAADAQPMRPDDIVVTAQRREQKLQDVGIAVSVLNTAALTNLNVTSATDIVRAVPNLKFNSYGSSQVVFNIRGVSQNDYGDQQEPPVAVYQDDSYASSITTASFPVFDLARTEVLRGPQGTLFGRNATGGAVQFISSQPTDVLDGYVRGTYGSFNQRIFEGAISGPIAPGLSVRLSGIYDRDDGYIENITPGQPDRGANNHWALRGIIQYAPTDNFKARLTVRYAEADHERQAALYALAPECPNAQGQGEFLSATQACAYWGSPPGAIATGYTNPSITPSQGGDAWKTAGTGDPYVDRKQFAATLRLEGRIGAFDVVSISDYQHLTKFYNEIGDAQPELPYVKGQSSYTPGPCAPPAQAVTCYAPGVYFYQGTKSDQYTQELRASTSFGRQYLVFGAFGMILNGNYTAKYATPFDGYDPTVAFSQKTRSWAIFAQDEWKIDDHWKLIGGLRFWHDHKVGTYDGSELFSGFTMHYGPDRIRYNDPTGTTPLTGVTATPDDASANFSGVTARAEIDYKPSRDTLIYASYNRGSKSGGFTFSTGTPTLGQSVIDTINNIAYKPETLNDYEVGLKTRLGANTTFNLAGFYYDYQHYQAFVQVGFTQSVRNLRASNLGVEAELVSHPLTGLTLQANASAQRSRVYNVLLPDGVTVVTHNLPQAPSFSAGGLIRYEFALAGGIASLQADALYQDKTCFTVMCAPVEREPAYDVENLRFGFTPSGMKLDLAVFVNNVLNHAYRVYAYDGAYYNGEVAGVYAKPRTWGVTATYHFGGQ